MEKTYATGNEDDNDNFAISHYLRFGCPKKLIDVVNRNIGKKCNRVCNLEIRKIILSQKFVGK